MGKKFNHVYQFKVMLQGICPPIWRRIQVPDAYTFWDLHTAIQDSMGWFDCHLHEFRVISPQTGEEMRIGIPDDEFPDDVVAGWTQKIADYFTEVGKKIGYTYDFGDGWDHRVELEKILTPDEDVTYPRCIKGKRACPPEDCGGVGGYYHMLEIIRDPHHNEYKDMMDWLGGEYDPEQFDSGVVEFDDPHERLATMLSFR